MPNGFTITNMPEAAEPSTLAEVTALVTASGTALSGVVVPLVFLLSLLIFRKPISEVIRNLSSLEGPGGMKVQTHERLGPATEAVEEMTAEETATAEPVNDEGFEDEAHVVGPVVPPEVVVVVKNPEAQTTAPEAKQEIVDAHEPTDPHETLVNRLRNRESHTPIWYFTGEKSDPYQSRRTFVDLLRTHPASAVLYVWNDVEAGLRALASARGLARKQFQVPARVLISQLKRLDAMPVELADLLREMMELRSDALNKSGQISEASAIEFRRSADVASREIARQIRLSPKLDPNVR